MITNKKKLAAGMKRAKREGWADRVVTASDRQAVADGCYFSQAAADRVVDFFARFLRHSKGKFAGQPFVLEDWQRERIVEPLFGWLRDDGTRRFRRAFIFMPKKNGKTTTAAGFSNYMLFGDGEQGAEVYNAATSQQQANICFNEAASMVRQSPMLHKRARIQDTLKRMIFDRTGSIYAAISAQHGTHEGYNIHFCVVDELHAHRNAALRDTLIYGGAARRQPLFLDITTAGVYDETAIGYIQYKYAKQLLEDQIVDPSFFAVLFEANEGDDLEDPATWRKANPGLGTMINEESFAEECREAHQVPSKLAQWKRYRLNMWSNSAVAWLPLGDWDAAQDDVTIEEMEGQDVFGGLDLASTKDLTAFVYGYQAENGDIRTRSHFWLPEMVLQDDQNPNVDLYRHWAESGHITLTPGNVTDYNYIYDELVALDERLAFSEVGYDPHQATYLVSKLLDKGVEMTEVRQSMRNLAPAAQHFENILIGRDFKHCGNPVQRLCAQNVSIKFDSNGNFRPVRDKAEKKIDGIVALVIMFSRLILNIDDDSIYSASNERGIVTC